MPNGGSSKDISSNKPDKQQQAHLTPEPAGALVTFAVANPREEFMDVSKIRNRPPYRAFCNICLRRLIVTLYHMTHY